jgi:hypothetical protein
MLHDGLFRSEPQSTGGSPHRKWWSFESPCREGSCRLAQSATTGLGQTAYAPTITGEAKVGSTLTAEEGKYGFWTYQWSNSEGPIDWATKQDVYPKTFRPWQDHLGHSYGAQPDA